MTFNPYGIPAKQHLCKIHRKATQFGLLLKVSPEDYDKYLCPCCSLPWNTQKISFSEATLEKIGQVSLRSKEYFQILLFFLAVLAVLFVCSSVPQFFFIPQISNCFLSFCFDEIEHLEQYYTNLKKKDELRSQSPDLILFFSILIIFVLKYWFFWFLVKQNKEYNRRSNFIKHYSVHAHNLKGETTQQIKEEVVAYFNLKTFKFLPGKKPKISTQSIVDISLIKDVSNIHALVLRFIHLIKRYKTDQKKGNMRPERRKKIKEKLGSIRRKIIQIRSARYLNEAFVTFDKTTIPKQIITNKWRLLFKKYITKDLFFSWVMNPQDIIWENFSDSDLKRLFKYCLSIVISAVIVLGTGRNRSQRVRDHPDPLLAEAVHGPVHQLAAGRLQLSHRDHHHRDQLRAAQGDRDSDSDRKE